MDKVLQLLNENARYSYKDIAVMLDMSEQAVEAHIKSLENTGVIRGFKPIVNWEKTSINRITALIEIKVSPQPDAGFEDIAKRIIGFDEVESLCLMSGGFDFAVTVRGESFQQVAMFVSSRLAPLPEVLSTATHFVLRQYKENGVEVQSITADDREVVSF